MKYAVLLAALILITGFSAGKVGYDGPENQPHIMSTPGSSSSASSSTAVGPNGTEWTAEVKQRASACRSGNQSEGISNITYTGQDSTDDERRVSFTGRMQTSNPCYTVEHEVTEKNGSYVMNVKTVSEGEACVQCVGAIEYSGEFSTDESFKLEVRHGGQKVDTLTYPGYEDQNEDGDDTTNPSGGFFYSIMNWLKGLF